MKKTYEEYLSMGMDEAMARYFATGRRRVICVQPSVDHTLILDFDDGSRRIYDCKPLMNPGSLFLKVANPLDFKRVFIDDTGNVAWDIDPRVDSSKVWTNRIDLSRDTCYVKSTPMKRA